VFFVGTLKLDPSTYAQITLRHLHGHCDVYLLIFVHLLPNTLFHTMRTHLMLLWATILVANSLHAQTTDDLNRLTRRLSDENKVEELIVLADQAAMMNDSSLRRVGWAFLVKDEYPDAIKYFTMSLEKNPQYGVAWYYRAACFMFMDQLDKAADDAQKAAQYAPNDPDMHVLRGDILAQLTQYDSALVCYARARALPDCNLRAWSLAADVYRQKGDQEKGLALNRELLPKAEAERDTDMIKDCLLMIGVYDSDHKEHKKAEKSFRRILELDPNHYTAVQDLIIVLYAQKRYKETKPYKDILYKAWREGVLPDHLDNSFIFDEFEYKGRKVMVIERFAEEGSLYYKHVFHVLDDSGDSEYTVQTESSLAITAGGHKYTMGRTTDTKHYTYIQFLFDEDFDYEEVKKAAIRIIAGKEEASSSSTLRKN
jgi:tetratricopeptide (TPR) repeat protein